MRGALGVAIWWAASCVSVAGPRIVDELAVHDYYTDCKRTPLNWSVSGGSILPPTPTVLAPSGVPTHKTISVFWAAGAGPGTVTATCGSDKRTVDVNIVKVDVIGNWITTGNVLEGAPAGGYLRATSQTPQGPSGIRFSAGVTATGTGMNAIKVGFVQVLRKIPVWQATYSGPPSPSIASYYNPPPWRDPVDPPADVWYENRQGVGVWNFSSGNFVQLDDIDSPTAIFPLKNSSNFELATCSSSWEFDTYICTQTIFDPQVYTIRASAHWVFNVSCARRENGTFAVGGSIVPPSPAAFTLIRSGARVEPIRGLTAFKATNPPNVRFP